MRVSEGEGSKLNPLLQIRPWLSHSFVKKNDLIARRERKWLVYKLKALGQSVTSKVRQNLVFRKYGTVSRHGGIRDLEVGKMVLVLNP